MRQLALFEARESAPAARGALDAKSERLIEQFGAHRLRQGASPRSVLRESSQLRSIARECSGAGPLLPLTRVFADVASVGQALREPQALISRATGRARLLAVHRFIQIMGPTLELDAAAYLDAVDALLPARRTSGWHTAGTVVAGERSRRRKRGPTLDAVDLHRIVDAAEAGAVGERSTRDRALVAVQCFSGLRAEEVVALRWENLGTDLAAAGYYGLTATVERSGRRLRLPLPGPAGEALDALKTSIEERGMTPTGAVFPAGARADRPLTYRGARKVLVRACRAAGLPPAASADLRAGCAYWLRSLGLSDHEVAAVLGIERVRTVDRLLSRHAALAAQRQVRELVER